MFLSICVAAAKSHCCFSQMPCVGTSDRFGACARQRMDVIEAVAQKISGRFQGNFTVATCSQDCLKRDAVTARRRRVFVHPCSGSDWSFLFFTDATCECL